MIIIYILLLGLGVLPLILLIVRSFRAGSGGNTSGSVTKKKGYPYQPNVEFRLPNGRLTTRGYAASHPEKFSHWMYGPDNVYGENIDPTDWEDWRINYYGE